MDRDSDNELGFDLDPELDEQYGYDNGDDEDYVPKRVDEPAADDDEDDLEANKEQPNLDRRARR